MWTKFFITSKGSYPVSPSTVSSIGKMWIRLPYLTSGHDWIETTSDKRTRKLFRTTRFMRIFSFGQLSSDRTIQTVSFLRFPFNKTVSPRNNCNSSILACDRLTIELSSLVASSTRRRFGRSLRFKIAVAKSSFLFLRQCNSNEIDEKQNHTKKIGQDFKEWKNGKFLDISMKLLPFRVTHCIF